MLEGSASLASYFFNKKNVNFGKQVGVQRKSMKSFPSFFIGFVFVSPEFLCL
jgi:hypothetical protein